MATCAMRTVIQHLRKAMLSRQSVGLTDGQLLETFITRKDEAAFETLVWRHGPMVLGVCRRILRNHHDAEDAFQATFLVLVRKAASVVPREMVANWLYGVACNTARRARTATARRHTREKHLTETMEAQAARPEEHGHGLEGLLDQELAQLPDKYRVPIVLCDLEGKTHKEAALQLGWPVGTVSGRLARGRTMLAERLTRKGLVLSAGSLAIVVSQNVARASVPPSLVVSTIKAASSFAVGQAVTSGAITNGVAALAEGVLKTMFVTRLKIAMLLFLGLTILGGGIVANNLIERIGPSGTTHTLEESYALLSVDRQDFDETLGPVVTGPAPDDAALRGQKPAEELKDLVDSRVADATVIKVEPEAKKRSRCFPTWEK